jgi:hypothetical protein
MDTFINKINKINKQVEEKINNINKEYQLYYFKTNNKLLLSKYNLQSLDDNSYINNYVLDRYSLIKDDTIDNLLHTLSCVYNIFDDAIWLKYAEDCFISEIKNYKYMFINSITENDVNSTEFNNFLEILSKYKHKFNLEVDKLIYEEENNEEDDDYKIKLSWIVVYIN